MSADHRITMSTNSTSATSTSTTEDTTSTATTTPSNAATTKTGSLIDRLKTLQNKISTTEVQARLKQHNAQLEAQNEVLLNALSLTEIHAHGNADVVLSTQKQRDVTLRQLLFLVKSLAKSAQVEAAKQEREKVVQEYEAKLEKLTEQMTALTQGKQSLEQVHAAHIRTIKSEAAKNNLNIGKFINKLIDEYKKSNIEENNWKEILYGRKCLTENDAKKMKEAMKGFRKEFEFR